MVYSNLIAEMARKKIRQSDIADKLGNSISSISQKLNGKQRLTFDEAMAIHDEFFPDTDIKYLFARSDGGAL